VPNNYLISNFLEKIRAEDGLALNTILSYGKDLELIDKFLTSKNLSFENASGDDIKDYFYELYKDNLRSASIARKISCLKNFYKFLESENIVKSSPTLLLQTPKKDLKLPKFLSEEEVFKLLDLSIVINRNLELNFLVC
jgi:site-specific recombinase XerD